MKINNQIFNSWLISSKSWMEPCILWPTTLLHYWPFFPLTSVWKNLWVTTIHYVTFTSPQSTSFYWMWLTCLWTDNKDLRLTEVWNKAKNICQFKTSASHLKTDGWKLIAKNSCRPSVEPDNSKQELKQTFKKMNILKQFNNTCRLLLIPKL